MVEKKYCKKASMPNICSDGVNISEEKVSLQKSQSIEDNDTPQSSDRDESDSLQYTSMFGSQRGSISSAISVKRRSASFQGLTEHKIASISEPLHVQSSSFISESLSPLSSDRFPDDDTFSLDNEMDVINVEADITISPMILPYRSREGSQSISSRSKKSLDKMSSTDFSQSEVIPSSFGFMLGSERLPSITDTSFGIKQFSSEKMGSSKDGSSCQNETHGLFETDNYESFDVLKRKQLSLAEELANSLGLRPLHSNDPLNFFKGDSKNLASNSTESLHHMNSTQLNSLVPLRYTFASHGDPHLCIVVVGFHHLHGPVIEFGWPSHFKDFFVEKDNAQTNKKQSTTIKSTIDTSFPSSPIDSLPYSVSPSEMSQIPSLNSYSSFSANSSLRWLPFLALPDASHRTSSGYVYFVLPTFPMETRIFGVSCYRLISADCLSFRDDSMTRTHVQKAVCILSQIPCFGSIQSKLEVVTYKYFNQRDFRDVSLLKKFFTDLNKCIDWYTLPPQYLNYHLERNQVSIGARLRPRQILMAIKAILLEAKIVIVSASAALASTAVLVLLSFIPGGLHFRFDSPGFDEMREDWVKLGVPLQLIQKTSVVLPYVSLQLLETLEHYTHYLIGINNQILLNHSLLKPDIIVDIDAGRFDIRNRDLMPAIALTDFDVRFLRKHIVERHKTNLFNLRGLSTDFRINYSDIGSLSIRSQKKNANSATSKSCYTTPTTENDSLKSFTSNVPTIDTEHVPTVPSNSQHDHCEVLPILSTSSHIRADPSFVNEPTQNSPVIESNTNTSCDSISALSKKKYNVSSPKSWLPFLYQQIVGETTEQPKKEPWGIYQRLRFKPSIDVKLQQERHLSDSLTTTNKTHDGFKRNHINESYRSNTSNTNINDEGEYNYEEEDEDYNQSMLWSTSSDPSELETFAIRSSLLMYIELLLQGAAYAAGPERSLVSLYCTVLSKVKDFGTDFLRLWSKTHNCQIWLNSHHLPTIPLLRKPPKLGWASVKYSNGDEYAGEFFQGLRHGRGMYIASASKVKYMGQWWADKRHGRGTLTHEESNFIYTGEWVNDKRQGFGSLSSSKETYVGNFFANKYHGRGSYTDNRHNEYDGNFVAGRISGVGRLRRADGEISSGSWINGVLTGPGQKLFYDGRTYIGAFLNNLPHGTGKMMFPDGTVYDGNWKFGKREGGGVLSVPADIFPSSYEFIENGSESIKYGNKIKELTTMIIDGVWESNLPNENSSWSITFPDGDQYFGKLQILLSRPCTRYCYISSVPPQPTRILTRDNSQSSEVLRSLPAIKKAIELCLESDSNQTNSRGIKNDIDGLNVPVNDVDTKNYEKCLILGHDNLGLPAVLPHGLGISKALSMTHEIYNGNWSVGRKHGWGECVYLDGTRYKGDWAYGLQHGRGTQISQDGRVVSGYFSKNQLIITTERLQGLTLAARINEDIIDSNADIEVLQKVPTSEDLDDLPDLWVSFPPFYKWQIDTSPYFKSNCVPPAILELQNSVKKSSVLHEEEELLSTGIPRAPSARHYTSPLPWRTE